jgi:putative proteasome-type protease
MTYCLAIRLDAGLIFASDSRTNAGVDQVSSYSKMYSFQPTPDRLFVILTAGNLGTTQGVINAIQRDLDSPAGDDLRNVNYLFEAAEYVGSVSQAVQSRHREEGQEADSLTFGASFIIGGQIAGHPHDAYMVYPEGNYVAASPTKPYLQIGETKYGKPILDRVITPQTSPESAARCALVSIDSTMRSNLSVGPPIELAFYEADSLRLGRHVVFDADTPYFESLKRAWGEGLQQVFDTLPRFDWEQD